VFEVVVPNEFASEMSQLTSDIRDRLISDTRRLLAAGMDIPQLVRRVTDEGFSSDFANWFVGVVTQHDAEPLHFSYEAENFEEHTSEEVPSPWPYRWFLPLSAVSIVATAFVEPRRLPVALALVFAFGAVGLIDRLLRSKGDRLQ
jgi:hypothetical protein